MSEKSLYRKTYHTYTDDANKLDKEVNKFLKSIFEKYMKKGYNPREISHIIHSAVQLTEGEVLLLRNIQIVKEKRQDEKTTRGTSK